MADHETTWLPTEIPQHGHSTAWRSAWSNQTEQWPVRAVPHHKWGETGLCPWLQPSSPSSSAWCSNRPLMTSEDEDFVYIRYRLDGSLFNLRRLQAHTKTCERLIMDLLFTDDAALVAHTQRALQRITSCFAESAQLFGLEVSLKKDRGPSLAYTSEWVSRSPHLHWWDWFLKSVEQFTYLGCAISSNTRIDGEIEQTDLQRQTVHLAGCTSVCGTTNT